jgi:heptose-I-phosphate ethanolaminephosphotransferase
VEHELTTREHAIFYLPVYRLAFSLRANQLAHEQVNTLVSHLGQVQVDSCDFRSPQIVLIIGESYNRYRSQLYGYERETTPRQMKRMRSWMHCLIP